MRRRPERKIFILVIGGAVVALGLAVGALGLVRGGLGRLVTPVSQGLSSAGQDTADGWGLIRNITSLGRENERLKREKLEAEASLAAAREELTLLSGLKDELKVAPATERRYQAAQVISYQPDSIRQFLTINVGRNQGLAVGMSVISQGHLVGKISQLDATSAKVFLVSDPNFKINALDSTSRASGTVKGQIGAGLIMEKIAQSDEVKAGDMIVTGSGEAGAVAAIPIGRVKSVKRRDNDVFQEALVVSPINFNRLEVVLVVR